MKKVGYITIALVILIGLVGPLVYTQKLSITRESGVSTAVSSNQPSSKTSGTENKSVNTGIPKDTGEKATSSPEEVPENITSSITTAVQQKTSKTTPSKSTPSNDRPESTELKQEESTGDLVKPTGEVCRVDIAVVGVKGQILYGPATVLVDKNSKWGLTALGALDATGLEYRMSPVYSGFVISIAGQANRGMCGWMYKVNGEIPMVAASEKKIHQDDNIIWWYSESMDNSGPSWESLKS